jgi:hypothetical protein
MQTPEHSDYELITYYINEGPCEINIEPAREWAPSLREALFWVARLTAGKSVSSILIPNKAHIGADQIRRLLDQLPNRPA